MDSAANNSLFMKFFTSPDRNQRLRLPLAWTTRVSNMGHSLPESATLRNRYGDIWVVTVAYDNSTKRYSFEDGWEIFVECNKVELKDSLVFKFDGMSTFDFKLFGKNNMEKEYVRHANINREAEELQEDIQLQPEEPEGQEQDTQLDYDDEVKEDEEPRPKKRKAEKGGKYIPKKRKAEKGAPAVMDADEDDIFRISGITRPQNPYFVTKRMRDRNAMYVPREVIRDNMLEFPEVVAIWDEKGREWKAQVSKWQDGRLWLSEGWRSYCKWNNVGFDDRCIMEIAKPETAGADIYLKAYLVPAASLQRS